MTTWGAYLRISEDPHDTQRGINRQREDAATVIAKQGGDGSAVVWYPENDTSAWKKRRVKVTDPTGREYFGYRVIRPVWHEALHDLRTGKISALVVWDLDRLARDPRDLEDAIEAVEHYGARVVSGTSSEIDLTTESGRLSARLHVMIATKSSADTSRRVARAHLESAQKGTPVGGRRPFGYNEDKVTIRESEAALIRKAAADVLAGAKLTAICQEWNAAGVRTVRQTGEWRPGTLLQLLRSPRLAGWRIYRPTGTKWAAVPAIALDKEGNLVRGQWEPILDDGTHKALVALLTNKPERRSHVPRRNRRQYLVTGLLRCGECSALMYGGKAGNSHYYRCSGDNCLNSASGLGVDSWVAEQVIARSELIKAQPLAPSTPNSARLAELNAQIDDTAEMIEDIMASYRAKQISAKTAFGNASKLEEARDGFVAERDALEVELAIGQPEHITAATWADMDVDHRRAAAERVLEHIACVRAPNPKANKFNPARLDPVWR